MGLKTEARRLITFKGIKPIGIMQWKIEATALCLPLTAQMLPLINFWLAVASTAEGVTVPSQEFEQIPGVCKKLGVD
ncbi:MAG: hypothetical protein PUP91_11925 [Rhizonema sp. PD37]|nr:hypothetical protein [Rhizonema sp. PD37]